MNKPVIGILGTNNMLQSQLFFNVERCMLSTSYVNAIANNGGIPFVIPYLTEYADLEHLVGLCGGLLLPGGDDIDPYLFGEHPHKKCGTIRPEMDRFTLKALEIASKQKKPVLGICRGLQAINVGCGGTLFQDLSLIENETILHSQTYDRSYTTHKVSIEKNTLLHSILNVEEAFVNTMHHQAINKLGNGLKATAFAPDGVIEAIESDDGLTLGVQWHPEELINSAPEMNKLFRYFINKTIS